MFESLPFQHLLANRELIGSQTNYEQLSLNKNVSFVRANRIVCLISVIDTNFSYNHDSEASDIELLPMGL